MSLSSQLSRIESKLEDLRRRDRSFAVFGSSTHRYGLNQPLPDALIRDFELRHGIELPDDYRWFVRSVGDGGAGPFLGLGKLEAGIFADMDNPTADYVLDLSRAFPYSQRWNVEFTDDSGNDDFEEAYFRTDHASGLLRICNYGCGVFISLVVNGDQFGYMWTDDRVNGNGIYPSVELGNEPGLSFIDWYEYWLDINLARFSAL